MKILKKEDLVRIGFVNKTSGFKGNLSCVIDISNPDVLLRKKFLFLIIQGLPVPFFIEQMEVRGSEIIVKFEDVESEQQAKKFMQKEIYADKIAGSKKNEIVNWKDLTGYHVTDINTGEIGEIVEVMEYPMQMIAKCIVDSKELLFPLNDDIVTEIDDDAKKVFIDLPEGFLDVYLK